MRRKVRRKQRVNSKKAEADGIKFASGLEKYTYLKLKEHKLFDKYEGEKFAIVQGFSPSIQYWERQSNGKGEFRRRDEKKVLGINYTPDFTSHDYIIECKGRANDTFPLRWKLFKKHQEEIGDNRPLYKPQTRAEVDIVVQIILDKRNGKEESGGLFTE